MGGPCRSEGHSSTIDLYRMSLHICHVSGPFSSPRKSYFLFFNSSPVRLVFCFAHELDIVSILDLFGQSIVRYSHSGTVLVDLLVLWYNAGSAVQSHAVG